MLAVVYCAERGGSSTCPWAPSQVCASGYLVTCCWLLLGFRKSGCGWWWCISNVSENRDSSVSLLFTHTAGFTVRKGSCLQKDACHLLLRPIVNEKHQKCLSSSQSSTQLLLVSLQLCTGDGCDQTTHRDQQEHYYRAFLSGSKWNPPPVSWRSPILPAVRVYFPLEWHLFHSHGSRKLTANKSLLLSELFLSLLANSNPG